MARNAYTLDGVPLMHPQLDYFPDKSSGVRILPAKRSSSLVYPTRDGEASQYGQAYEAGSVAITMNVYGADHESFMQNVEFLRGLFGQRHKLLELRHHYREDGTNDRIAMVQFNASSEVGIKAGARSGTMDFFATIPGTFWRSANTITDVVPVTTSTLSEATLSGLSGSNAPITDALIRVKGQFSELTIKDVVSGHTLHVTFGLAANEYLIIDTSSWTARKVTTNTWDGGVAQDSLVTSSRGSGPMFTLEPMILNNAFVYRIATSGATLSGAQVEVRAKKSYL